MKKYTLLIVTVFLLLLTAAAYALENNNREQPDLKLPTLNLASTKYGQIKNIVWLSNFVVNEKALLFLANNNKAGQQFSSLYYFNIDSNDVQLLGEYPAHPYLDNVILFNNPFASNSIITASASGIVKTDFESDQDGNLNPRQEYIDINGFEQSTSFDYKGTLFYARANDPLLYTKNLSLDFFTGFRYSSNNTPTEMTFFRKPSAIINANSLNRTLTYTSLEHGRYNLYSMRFNGSPVTKFNLPVVKDVRNVQAVEDGYGFIGLQAVSEPDNGGNEKSLNLFMARMYPAESNDMLILDTIPDYTDPFGAVPALDSTTYNHEYTLVYTVYDQNHQGTIKICGNNRQPQTIVAEENIFGPVRIARKNTGDLGRTQLILYFSQDKNEVKIKICDLQGNLVEDISSVLLGE